MYYDPYEVLEDRYATGTWRAESIGDDGDVLVAIFAGTDAEHRAYEYAASQNQTACSYCERRDKAALNGR